MNNEPSPHPDLYKTDTRTFRESWIGYISGLQEAICSAVSAADGKGKFVTDEWSRKEGAGGGGTTCTIAGGKVFEKGGVNTSVVYGRTSQTMRTHLKIGGTTWFASGLSLVLHPLNPYVPSVHANWRYFELYDGDGKVLDRWFGGGTDLTPYYLFSEDAQFFHRALKKTIDPFGKERYPKYKKECDAYFANRHRDNEMRGVGGVFYDHLRPGSGDDAEKLFAFQKACGDAFPEAYLPIVSRRKDTPYTSRQTEWQEIRRGRYVEFNLIHDRGTVFGLKTGGRTESILMSLPPRARWIYGFTPEEGTPEFELLEACRHPVDWVDM